MNHFKFELACERGGTPKGCKTEEGFGGLHEGVQHVERTLKVEGRTTATQQDYTRLLYPSTQAPLRNRRAVKLPLSQIKERRDLEAYQARFTQPRRRTRQQSLKPRWRAKPQYLISSGVI
jgi:hypothetical protein